MHVKRGVVESRNREMRKSSNGPGKTPDSTDRVPKLGSQYSTVSETRGCIDSELNFVSKRQIEFHMYVAQNVKP